MHNVLKRYHYRRRRLLTALACWVAICPAAIASHVEDPGPLAFQNRFPLHFLFLTPRPASPVIPRNGQWHAAAVLEYTSVNFDHRNGQWDFVMDMELATLNVAFALGLGDRLAVSFEAPLVTMQDGFLDGFLETYHDTLNVSNYGREDRPRDTYGYVIRHDGEVWIDSRTTGWSLADSTLSLDFALPRPSASGHLYGKLMGRVKLPVGDPDLGLGSGQMDIGIYWSAGWNSGRWSFYLMPGYAWIADPDTRGAEIQARNSMGLFLGAGFHYNERWRWVAQINGYSSMVETTGISELDNGSVQLDIGFRYRIRPNWHLLFSFAEDLTLATPDFTLRAGMTWTP